VSVVEPELALFQMQGEGVSGDAVELRQSTFGKTPERLDSVDVMLAPDELVIPVVDPEMFIKTDVYQPVVATPAIGVDDAVNVCPAANDGLQRGFGGIGDNFGVNAITPLEQTEDDGFAKRATPSFAPDAPGTKVRFVRFQFTYQRRALHTPLLHTLADAQINRVDRTHRNASQRGALGSRQIQRKVTHKLTKSRLADFRTSEIPIFPIHLKKLACFKNMFAS